MLNKHWREYQTRNQAVLGKALAKRKYRIDFEKPCAIPHYQAASEYTLCRPVRPALLTAL